VSYKHFISGKLIAFDTETTGLRLFQKDEPFCFGFFNDQGEKAVFEWPVDPFTRCVEPVKREYEQVKNLLEDERITKVAFNGKFDVRASERIGIIVAGPGGSVRDGGRIEEVVFAAHACNSKEPDYKLKPLAYRKCGIPMSDEESLVRCVRRMRLKGSKAGWKIAYDFKEKEDGTIEKAAAVAADYWIPYTSFHRKEAWASSRDASLCKYYCGTDCERTMILYLLYLEEMTNLDVRDTYEREIELFDTVYRMETHGVTVSKSRIASAIEDARSRADESKSLLEKKYGWEGINLNSPPQVAKMLYDINKVPLAEIKVKRGKRTNPRTTAVEEISVHSSLPVVSEILKWRTCSKGIGTFYKKYLRLGVAVKHNADLLTLHSSFKQTGTDTGRYSSSDPNLQQVSSPESSRHGAVLPVRDVFIPDDGDIWIASDFDGQEIRLYAEVSSEPSMMKALEQGKDIHQMIIDRVCGGEGNRISIRSAVQAIGLDGRQVSMNPEMVQARKDLGVRSISYSSQDQDHIAKLWLKSHDWNITKAEASIGKKNTRGRLKQATFGKCYGASAKTLALTLQEPVEEAEFIMGVYDEEFPLMRQFMKDKIREVRVNGHVRTLWNRRLVIDPEKAYTVVNYLIQGTAGDLLKQSQQNLDDWFIEEGLDANIMLPIHDELISRMREVYATAKFIRRYSDVMEDHKGHLQFTIPTKPLLIDTSWHRPRKFKGYSYN